MEIEFEVPKVVPEGCKEKPNKIKIEVFDEWKKLQPKEQAALTDLMTHYLQKHWDEQYIKLISKEQKGIKFVFVQLHALEDLKKDINYKLFHNNLGSLGRSILQAHAKLIGIPVKDSAPCEKVSPNMLASTQEEKHQLRSPKRP